MSDANSVPAAVVEFGIQCPTSGGQSMRTHGSSRRVASSRALVFLLVATATAGAQNPDSARFTLIDTMVAMRDGVRLHTKLYVPKRSTGPLPILFSRTPYGIDQYYRPGLSAIGADDGYIFALQDLRGRSRSEGEFVMDRPPLTPERRKDPAGVPGWSKISVSSPTAPTSWSGARNRSRKTSRSPAR
jgi:hypothetical protein